MRDLIFMALALIVSEKMTSSHYLDKGQLTVKSRPRLKIECRIDFYLQDVCMIEVSWL